MPGLVNTHTHAPMALFRGLADDLALMDWLNNYIFPAEAKLSRRSSSGSGTRLAALEMIESGTTTFADMYYFEEEIAQETSAAGLRGVLGQTVIQFPVADAKTPADGLKRAEAFINEFKGDALITPAVAPHALYTLDATDAEGRTRSVPTLWRADAHPPGRDAGRGEDRAGAALPSPVGYLTASGSAARASLRHMASGSTEMDIRCSRQRASACRTIPRAT